MLIQLQGQTKETDPLAHKLFKAVYESFDSKYKKTCFTLTRSFLDDKKEDLQVYNLDHLGTLNAKEEEALEAFIKGYLAATYPCN